MTVLALESDPAQAATIRHIVNDLVRARLTLVQSVEHAVQALQADEPDLILLPALVSPAEEEELLTSLRTLHQAHVEILITPVLAARDEPATVIPRGWRPWGSRPSTRSADADDLHLFAERLGWSLERARQRQQRSEESAAPYDGDAPDAPNHVASTPDVCVHAIGDSAAPSSISVVEHSPPLFERIDTAAEVQPMSPPEDFNTVRLLPAGDSADSQNLTTNADEPPVDPPTEVVADTSSQVLSLPDTTSGVQPGPCVLTGFNTNRRAHPRFSGSELQGLRTARLKFGPPVSFVDVSAGGALIETEARLQPDSHSALELVGDQGHVIVPFRVVRCQVSALNGSLRYRSACAFIRALDLANLVQPHSIAGEADAPLDAREPFDLALKTMLEPYLRRADGKAGTRSSLGRQQLPELLRSLRTVIRQQPGDPLDREIAAAVVGATPEGDTDRSGDPAERRRHVRVNGPFDGLRLGAIETPVVIYDLSEGGCFVNSFVETEAGRQLSLKVSVPGEDWITAVGEVVHGRPGFGFAVRFVEMPDASRACLSRLVASRAGSVVTDDVSDQAARRSA